MKDYLQRCVQGLGKAIQVVRCPGPGGRTATSVPRKREKELLSEPEREQPSIWKSHDHPPCPSYITVLIFGPTLHVFPGYCLPHPKWELQEDTGPAWFTAGPLVLGLWHMPMVGIWYVSV